MKLAVLGGGGVRSPFLVKSIVGGAKKIGLNEVVFMDNNEKKLATFGVMAKKMASILDPKISFEITSDPVKAVKNADFVITTLRVGEDAGRVKDERIALNAGVLGQETTGAGGFAMALRSVPTLKNYCKLIQKHAKKNAPIFNFTNPSGIVAQALRSEGFDTVYGICDSPSGFKTQLEEMYGATKPEDLTFKCFGLNHLSWFKEVKLRGKDITKKIVNDERLYKQTEMHFFDRQLVRISGDVLLNEYLYFWYYRDQAVKSILASKKTRGETILEINAKMMKELEKFNIEKELDKAFEVYMTYYLERENSYMAIESSKGRPIKRKVPTLKEYLSTPDNGGYAGVALNFIKAFYGGEKGEMILSVPNNGAIEGFDDEDVVEITCTIDKKGARPIKIGKVPEMQMNLMKTVKFYEKKAVEAIKNKSIDAAITALTVHPLVNSYSIAKKIVPEYLEAHKEYTGVWK